MPRRRRCDFCESEIEPGTGTMFVRTNGATIHFCSSKCEYNAALGRESRDLEWAGEEDEETEEEGEEKAEWEEGEETPGREGEEAEEEAETADETDGETADEAEDETADETEEAEA